MKNFKVTGIDPTNKLPFEQTLSGEFMTIEHATAEANLLFGTDSVTDVTPLPDTITVTPFSMMDLFVKFSLNYNSGFINRAFAENAPHINRHLESKFDSLYARYGANAVMVRFWCELDIANQNQLANYIVEYYENLK